MSWLKNGTRDDANHPQPQKLPPNEWRKPGQRAALAREEVWIEPGQTMHVRDDNRFVVHPAGINLRKFEHEMTRDRIADIKEIVGKLTYGEMISMAEQITGSYPRLPGDDVTQDEFKAMLPQALHRWSKDVGASDHPPVSAD